MNNLTETPRDPRPPKEFTTVQVEQSIAEEIRVIAHERGWTIYGTLRMMLEMFKAHWTPPGGPA